MRPGYSVTGRHNPKKKRAHVSAGLDNGMPLHSEGAGT